MTRPSQQAVPAGATAQRSATDLARRCPPWVPAIAAPRPWLRSALDPEQCGEANPLPGPAGRRGPVLGTVAVALATLVNAAVEGSAVRGAAIRFVVGNVLYPALAVADTVIATTHRRREGHPDLRGPVGR